MARHHTLKINGQIVSAEDGETLVEAALGASLLIPTDCSAGQCGCCRVTVRSGSVDAQGTQEDDTVLACQARVNGPVEIEFEPLPMPIKAAGTVSEINELSPEMVEVVVKLRSPLEYRPGQYVRLKFSGFPGREYSPTHRMNGESGQNELLFHIRRIPDGLVSSEIGHAIQVGLPVSVQGPFGTAYLRNETGPLVLVAGGSGWAPIWSLAIAARGEQRNRELHVVAGSRDAENLYMRRALDWLIADGAANVIATSEFGATDSIRPGLPTHHLPEFGPDTTVYVAGPPGLVNAVKSRAREARSRCHSDPFLPNGRKPTLLDNLTRRWNGLRGASSRKREKA